MRGKIGSNHCTDSQKSEQAVSNALRNRGIKNRLVRCKRGPYDILCKNGTRVEVKHSAKNAKGVWRFAISRHRELDESEVDFYVLSLTGLAKWTRIFVVLPAPLETSMVQISLRSLFNQHAANIRAFDLIREMEMNNKKRAK